MLKIDNNFQILTNIMFGKTEIKFKNVQKLNNDGIKPKLTSVC